MKSVNNFVNALCYGVLLFYKEDAQVKQLEFDEMFNLIFIYTSHFQCSIFNVQLLGHNY